MKTTILILGILLSAVSLATAAAPEAPQEIIVGLSPFQPASERAKQQALLQRFFVTDAPTDSRIVVWDAWNLRVLCDVRLPKFAYDSPAARAPRIVAGIDALKQWSATLDGMQIPVGVRHTAAINIPEWLQAATAEPATGRRTVVILASPFCFVPNEPSFSMVEARYPSDAHLNAGDKSIYSIVDKHGRLANTVVLWAYPSENVWTSQYHHERVLRWWSLFIAGQGPNAKLAGFSSDASQVMLAAGRVEQRAIGEYIVNTNDAALVMHTAAVREVPVQIRPALATPPVKDVQPSPAPPIAKVEPAPAPPANKVELAPALVTAKVEPPAAHAPVGVVVMPPPALPLPKRTVLREVVRPAPVFLDVTVVDRANHPIVDLERSDFSVFEDGVRQETESYTRERTPISLVVLIDTSGSISSKLSRIRAAASSIVRQGLPQDEFSIVRFTSVPTLVHDFTTNVASFELALERLKAGGETALLDAVKYAIQYANERGKHDRKGVILITDGGEADSRCSREEILAALRIANTRLYSVAFPDGLDQSQSSKNRDFGVSKSRDAESRARNLLDELAQVSGGRGFYPRQATELDGIAQSIALELRTQYRLSYRPARMDGDGKWREVRVELVPNQGRGEMIARTRSGYFARKSP